METPQPIGASFVQFISGDSKSPSDNPVSTIVAPPGVRLPCILMPGGNKKSDSMLVNGPENSGKTSMAMSLAYSCAASLDCPCVGTTACRCAASILFRFSTDSQTPFPPTCHHFPNIDRTDELPSSYSHLHCRQKPPENEYLHRSVLQRIRIVYVDSVVHIIKELLALRRDSNNIRCIIVDDLDKIAGTSENGTSAILQTVAAIMETRNSMKTGRGAGPSILITSTASIETPWMDTITSLRMERSPPSWQREHFSGGVAVSHWRASFQYLGILNDELAFSSADYMFINQPSGDVRIYWREV